jgi:iron complex transport system substrate-binding protein
MKRGFFLGTLSLVLISLPGIASAGPAHEVTDALGFKTRIAVEHPSRIVTLMPSLGEIAADLAGDRPNRIVGVSVYSDFPRSLRKVETVASATQVNLEAVVALHPDLVLAAADGNQKDQLDHLRELGLPVVEVNSASFHDLEQSIALVGLAMGERERSDVMVARLLAGLAQIQGHARVRGLHPSVLFELGTDPLIVVGAKSFLSEAIELVGGRNIFADLLTGYPRPGLEEVVARDPETIVIPVDKADSDFAREAVAYWNRFSKMKAVATKHVRAFPSGTLLRPTPRILEGLIVLEHAIYGKAP